MKVRTWWTVLCAAALVANASAAGAQENKPGYKDPKAAITWGYLLPGAGHLYAGESGKGWLVMLTSVGAAAAGTVITLNSGDENADTGFAGDPGFDLNAGATDWTPSYIGWGVFSLGWIYSIVDAPKAAVRANEKLGYAGAPRLAPYVATRDGGPEYGVRVSIAL